MNSSIRVAGSANEVPGTVLGQRLSDPTYVRMRTCPSISNIDYLQLKDLYALLKSLGSNFRGDVFDYGCGGAPYGELFKECGSYIRADVTPSAVVDRLLPTNGLTEEAPDSFDWVISTQVLEHVKDPREYLEECRRILRRSGQILVTTHGMIVEHGCPYDFQRWTGNGLEILLRNSGFEIVASGKLTTEARAAVQLAHQLVLHLRADGRPLLHYPLAVLRHLYALLCIPSLNLFAELFPRQAIVPTTDPSTLYTGVYVHGRKA